MFKQGYQHIRGRLKNEIENLFYERIYYSLKAYEKRVLIPEEMHLERAAEIVKHVFEENPSFFQFSPYNIRFIQNTYGCFIDLCYQYSKAEFDKCEMMIKEQIAYYIQQSQIMKMDTYGKILLIFNLIVDRGIYNSLIKDDKNQGTIEDYNIVGLFRNKTAACYGFAQAFKLLCDEVGIRCMIIKGELCNDAKESHAWNLVECNHKFYHVDTTLALNKNDILSRYQFFMVDSTWISRTRIIDPKLSTPDIGGLEYTIYFQYGLHFETEKNMKAYFEKVLNSRKREIVIHIDNMSSARVQKCFNSSLKKYNAENQDYPNMCYTFSALSDYGLFCFRRNTF